MSQDAGFPPGITAGDLGRRILAHVVDAALPVLVSGGAAAAIALLSRTDLRIVFGIIAGLICLAWAVVLLWSQGIRGASPGMRLMKLEVVAVENGKPIGWARAFIRLLVFGLLSGTVVGLIVMLVLMVTHPRRQGWHDQASRAVVINARETAPAAVELPGARQHAPTGGAARSGGAGTVGLPPALGGNTAGSAGSAAQVQQTPYQQVQGPGPVPGATPGGPEGAGQTGVDLGSHGAPNPFFTGGAQDADEPVADSTRLVPRAGGHQRRPDQGWAVVLSDGRQVSVESLVLLGRNPQPRVGEEVAELVSIVDQSRTVSKTHIAVGVDSKGIWVMDRGSTNGSAIATNTGTFEPCVAGERVRVREGQVVSFGDQRLEIRRSYPTTPSAT